MAFGFPRALARAGPPGRLPYTAAEIAQRLGISMAVYQQERLGARHVRSGVRGQESGSREQGTGVREQRTGVRGWDSGVRSQGAEVRSRESAGRASRSP